MVFLPFFLLESISILNMKSSKRIIEYAINNYVNFSEYSNIPIVIESEKNGIKKNKIMVQ